MVMKSHTSHVKGHRIVRSVCGMLLAFSMMFFHTGYTAYADDDDVEIKKVTINIKSDITKEDSDAIEVKCSGEGFTYDGFETIIPNGNSWNASEYPRIIVTLEADEGYKFKKSSLSVNVKGDVYKVVSKKSTKDELKVTVDLEPYGGKIGAPVNPHWGGTTTASWQKGYRATSYMVVLKRDGRTVTSAETTSTSYDFYDYMEGGQKYTFSVVSKNGKRKSVAVTSDETTYSDPGGERWIRGKRGWWYRYADNSYPANGWYQLSWNGVTSWYYFNAKGYLLQNQITPDNYVVGADGAWIENPTQEQRTLAENKGRVPKKTEEEWVADW